MRVTERDIKLLKWINKFGFVTINQVTKFLGIKKSAGYEMINRLVVNKYLLHEMIFHRQKGAYKLTPRGAALADENLPALRRINIMNYNHDIKLTDLILDLQHNLNYKVTTEREIRHNFARNSWGTQNHTPDAILDLNSQNIALELELTRKSKARFDKIFQHYLQTPKYKEVWYFSDSKEVLKFLAPYSEKANFFKVFNLDTFFEDTHAKTNIG